MDYVVANPAFFAIILFGVVSIISGIMLTGRDLDPIERVLPTISGIQKWCGIGIFMAAIIVFMASPLTGKHLWLAEQAASNAASGQADALASDIATSVTNQLVLYLASANATTVSATISGAVTSYITAHPGAISAADATGISTAIGTALQSMLQMSDATKAQLNTAIQAAVSENLSAMLAQASPGALTHKATVTFYNPLSNVWGTMLGIFGILILVFSQITAKYGDQKPLSTMILALWPVIIAMCIWTWLLYRNGSGDVPGIMLDTFIMLVLAAIALPLCILGMREKPREAGEWAGYAFIILGIDGLYIGIKYLWLFEVQPFLHMSSAL